MRTVDASPFRGRHDNEFVAPESDTTTRSRSRGNASAREREKSGGRRLGKSLRWPHARGADDGGRREERERVCVNENLMALVRSRELRLRGERTRRDKNVRDWIKCPVTSERVTALVARLNVVGGWENTAGPQVDYLSDLRLSWLGLCRSVGRAPDCHT